LHRLAVKIRRDEFAECIGGEISIYLERPSP
jgi:hypothetical protein